MLHKIFYCAKVCNKQSAKVICRFDRLRKVHRKGKSHMSTGKLLTAHAFDHIVLRVNPGLTRCEGLAIALSSRFVN